MKEYPFDPNDKATLERVRKMPVFDAMELSQLPHLLKLAKLRRFESGETIITEGDTDQLVYFLILGRCVVEVEGMEVNAIEKLGDVFGEMGMIDHKPRSATITADKPVVCLVMDGTFLEHMEGVDKLASQALFYRIFSEMLAARIRDANAKVLQLENELKELSVDSPLL